MSAVPSAHGLGRQLQSLDHQFWLCIGIELVERLSYYGLRMILPVYLVLAEQNGGAGLSHLEKGIILAWIGATQTWLPAVFGGFVDRFGYRNSLAAAAALKIVGYLTMAFSTGFWGLFAGSQLMAIGTGIFKPSIEGCLAHRIASSGAGSVAWGIYFQVVNLGALLAVFVPMMTRDVYGYRSVFLACACLALFNLLFLRFFEEPSDERLSQQDIPSFRTVCRDCLVDLATDRRMLAFIIISAGFWFTYHQIFDLLPNYIDDWTDSNSLLLRLGRLFDIPKWQQLAGQGSHIPQEWFISINALLISTTMFLFAWLSSRIKVLNSIAAGMGVASLATLPLIYFASAWTIIGVILVFTVGEMLASPKRQEFFASIAPPGKRAMYMGYSNLPDGIGWFIGAIWAGSSYDQMGDKINLTRRFIAAVAPSNSLGNWSSQLVTMNEDERIVVTQRACEALGLNVSQRDVSCSDLLQSAPEAARVISEILPRARVIDFAVTSVPILPNGQVNSPEALRDYLFATYHPGNVWLPFCIVGVVSVALMIAFSLLNRRQPATKLSP